MLGCASECMELQEKKKYAGHDVTIEVIALRRCPIPAREPSVGEWLSLVEHLVRDQGVGGSNPLSPTNLFNEINRASLSRTQFFVIRETAMATTIDRPPRKYAVARNC